jgi:hypothetical protein
VEGHPFRLSFTDHGRVVTGEVIGRAGPGSRLSYTVVVGALHRIGTFAWKPSDVFAPSIAGRATTLPTMRAPM